MGLGANPIQQPGVPEPYDKSYVKFLQDHCDIFTSFYINTLPFNLRMIAIPIFVSEMRKLSFATTRSTGLLYANLVSRYEILLCIIKLNTPLFLLKSVFFFFSGLT